MSKITQPLFVPVVGTVHIDLSQRLSALIYRLRNLSKMDSNMVFERVLELGINALENDSSALDFEHVPVDASNSGSINNDFDWHR